MRAISVYLNAMSDQEILQPPVDATVDEPKSENDAALEASVETIPTTESKSEDMGTSQLPESEDTGTSQLPESEDTGTSQLPKSEDVALGASAAEHNCDVSSTPDQQDTPASSDSVLINGADLAPVGGEPESALDDDPLSELSQRFVDQLNLPIGNPELVRADAQSGDAADSAGDEPDAEEIKKFNESMVMISAYAEDVVKTWFAQIYDRPMEDVFPDGLTGNVGSVTMLPSEEMIRARRRARVGHDEEVRDDNMCEDDSAGWELRLAVVDGNHRTNLDEWKLKEPVVLQHMQGLLKMAWGYINYAIESYDLPDKELFIGQVYPSPWGTLYVNGAPETVPQIGVTIERIQPKPKSE